MRRVINNVNPFVSTHSHPKVAAKSISIIPRCLNVSTHSHPKVAAGEGVLLDAAGAGFNTQPPEGGCRRLNVYRAL